jgi:class 3 adenylate cyclase/HAMP domain-containing protein
MKRRHFRFEVQLILLGILLLLTLGLLLSALSFVRLEATTGAAMNASFDASSGTIKSDLLQSRRLLEQALRLTAGSHVAHGRTFADRQRHVATLVELLGTVRAVVAAYVGYPNGGYLYVRALDPATPEDRSAPAGSVYLVRDLDRSSGTLVARKYFLDARLHPTASQPETEDLLDARTRPWFTTARTDTMLLTDPYRLGSSHQLGFTASLRGPGGSVAAVSLGLLSLSVTLARAAVIPGTQIALIGARGDVFALSDPKRLAAAVARSAPNLPTVTGLGMMQLQTVLDNVRGTSGSTSGTVDVPHTGAVLYRIDTDATAYGAGRHLLTTIPESALYSAYRTIRFNTLVFSALILLAGVLVAWWLGRSIARPLERMTDAAERLVQLDFTPYMLPPSGIREIDALAATFTAMRTRLSQFTALSAALAENQDLQAILDRTLAEIVASLGAGAGVAYIAQADRLVPTAVCGLTRVPTQAPPAGGLVLHAANVREPLQLGADAHDPTLGDAFAELPASVRLRVLALPFISRGGDLVALVLAARLHDADQPFPESAVAYGRSFAGSTALALEAQRYLDDLERFNDAAACFVPSAFLEQLECSDISAVSLGDYRRRTMTVFCSDIRSFTTISEELGVERTFEFLTAYLRRVGPCVRGAGGFIDRYVGDAIIALFPERPADAVAAAVALQREVRAFNRERPAWLERAVAAGVGIDTGEFILGTIGEAERYATASISPAVARAETIESRTVFFGAPILITEAVERELDGTFFLRALPLAAPDDGDPVLRLFEVVDGDDDELRDRKRASAPDFAAAVELFDAGRFAPAEAAFAALAHAHPDDLPAARLRDRCREHQAVPSHSGWAVVASTSSVVL